MNLFFNLVLHPSIPYAWIGNDAICKPSKGKGFLPRVFMVATVLSVCIVLTLTFRFDFRFFQVNRDLMSRARDGDGV